jgi:hypothetical protein
MPPKPPSTSTDLELELAVPSGMSTTTKALLALGALGLAYYLFKKKR